MSNLGLYQIITTAAKKVHGPKNLITITLVIGYLAIRPIEAGVKKGIALIKKPKSKSSELPDLWLTVLNTVTDEQGLILLKDSEIKILANNKDAILIAVAGDDNSPYFVSLDFLKSAFEYTEDKSGKNQEGIVMESQRSEYKDETKEELDSLSQYDIVVRLATLEEHDWDLCGYTREELEEVLHRKLYDLGKDSEN